MVLKITSLGLTMLKKRVIIEHNSKELTFARGFAFQFANFGWGDLYFGFLSIDCV